MRDAAGDSPADAVSSLRLGNAAASPAGPAERWLVRALVVFAVLDLLALGPVFFPYEWMNEIHRRCGLGELPREPIVSYLARTASLLYALHGAVILFVAFDVRRYWPLVRFLAMLAIVHGGLLVFIDLREALPGWWQAIEGFCIAAMGGAVLWLLRRAGRERSLRGDAVS
ncbi:MAG: hypothetical protein IT428_25180 [Planctomycetaceae bacterium]|nr:hypothetical protein [Planctomycetaceae bacterium]